MYIGSWDIDDYLTFSCNTHNPDTAVAADADGEPAYRVYEDETAVPILTGTLSLLDDANTTGFYSERIQLTAANGFEAGKSYTVRIAATVAGLTGATERFFQIKAPVNVVSWKGTAAPDIATETDISEAVRDQIVEPAASITLGQAMAFILSACAGVTDDDGLTFKTSDGTIVRIAATVVGSERTVITLTDPVY